MTQGLGELQLMLLHAQREDLDRWTGGWRALMRRQRCFATEPSAGGFYVEGYAEGLFAMSDRTAELQRYRKKRRDISGDALS